MNDVLHRLGVDHAQIAAFCAKWNIAKLELFGSILREDFDDDSDVDLLVTFEPGAAWTFHDELHMTDELSALLARPVDLIERSIIESSPNWVRRRNILSTAQTLYAAA